MVFLPGCPDSRWAALPGASAAERLGVRLVAVNRPGYGASTPAPGGQRAVADDLVALLDALELDRVAVLGMSVGGLYAWALAGAYPERVTALGTVACPADLALLDPPAHRDHLTEDEQRALGSLRDRPRADREDALRPEFEQWRSTWPWEGPPRAIAARWLVTLSDVERGWVVDLPEEVHARSAREALGSASGYLRDAADLFGPWEVPAGSVRCPVWIWHGSEDSAASPRMARALAEQAPQGHLVLRQGHGHLDCLHAHWEEMLRVLTSPG